MCMARPALSTLPPSIGNAGIRLNPAKIKL